MSQKSKHIAQQLFSPCLSYVCISYDGGQPEELHRSVTEYLISTEKYDFLITLCVSSVLGNMA